MKMRWSYHFIWIHCSIYHSVFVYDSFLNEINVKMQSVRIMKYCFFFLIPYVSTLPYFPKEEIHYLKTYLILYFSLSLLILNISIHEPDSYVSLSNSAEYQNFCFHFQYKLILSSCSYCLQLFILTIFHRIWKEFEMFQT
jgi:hypothetical protein